MNIPRLMLLRNRARCLIPKLIFTTHTETCPLTKQEALKAPTKPTNTDGTVKLKRSLKSGKVRFGFIPDEWFVFFYSKTGVTGPYIFGILLTNYLVSKEIYVMEHEYYLGLSVLIITLYGTKKLGPILAATLDKSVNAVEAELNATRKQEEMHYENIIKEAKDCQWRAHGQKLLMEAKKENVSMQLEAAFRERQMKVFKAVKRRLDYHMHLHRLENRIQQKWIKMWIVENVIKSITPDLEKQIIDKAITDLSALASRG